VLRRLGIRESAAKRIPIMGEPNETSQEKIPWASLSSENLKEISVQLKTTY
jgi:hypothetical protein